MTTDRRPENLLRGLLTRFDTKSKHLRQGCSLNFSFALRCAVALAVLAVSGLCWQTQQARAANFQPVQSGIIASAWGDVNNDGWSDIKALAALNAKTLESLIRR